MKLLVPARAALIFAFRLAVLLIFPITSFSQTFFGVASTPGDNLAQAGATATITPPAAMLAGDLVVVYAHYRNTTGSPSISVTGGQAWSIETTPAAGGNQAYGIFWCRYNGTWSANPVISGGSGSVPLSGIMYVYRPASSANSWGIHVPAVDGSTTNTAVSITGLTTTVPRTVTMAFWASPAATTWGTLTGAGWLKTGLANQYRNTSGSDQSHTAAYNIRPTAGAVANVSQTQNSSQNTRRSIISWFELAPPANDLCAGAISLTSSTSCVNTAGTLVGSTYTTIPTIGCGIAARNDVWYSFVAQSTNPTISLSSAPANPRVQLFSGTCAGLTSVACGNTSGVLAATGLAIGTTYYVRVYADPNDAGTFNICVTDPPPVNDLCANAIVLTSASTCVNTTGTLLNATYTAIPTIGCGIATRNDVWYRFVAQTTNPTITLSSAPANPRLQLFSGSCAGLTSVTCGTGSISPTGLTIGNTYFVRVYTDPNASGTFDICVVDPVPANDLCSGAISLTSGTVCGSIQGNLLNATYTAIPTIGCGVASRNDVWYSFVAVTTNPTITLTSAPANPRIQLFSGTCASLTSLACGNGSLVASGLTVGTTYFIRIYTDPNVSGTFNICIVDPVPVNNLCGGAVTLTSSTTCVNTAGNMYTSTLTATTITAPNCAAGVVRDVWYEFVAQSTNPTITLSSLGVNFTNPGMQLLSDNCGGTFTPYFCGTTSIAADFLVPGTTYYIRVYTTTATAPASLVGWNFDICVTDPVPPVPPNDECINAINLLISASCSNVPGTMTASTASVTPIAPCTGPVAYDVWYKFTAVSNSSTITLSGAGSNFNTPRLQLFTGVCGALSSIACGTTTITNATVSGTTYYVRVYSITGPPPTGNANFNICVAATGALVRFGNSYVNITRKTTGGVVQTGDILEIRMTVNHTSGTMTNLRYVDNLPTHTAIANTAPHDSIKIITNEGLRYKKYTLATGDDAGSYLASPPAGQYNIRLNLGFGVSAPGTPINNTSTEFASATGTMNAGSDRPRGGGGMLFAISYRVRVTGVTGDTIQLNPGQFIYRNGGGDIPLTATPFKIVISDPLSLCANSIGINNAVEYGGTFGAGTSPNRLTDLTNPISGYSFVSNVNANNAVGDGRYGIVKNLSPRNSPVSNARRQPNCTVGPTLNINDPLNCNNRMFGGFWYIDGDHSGTNNAIGNPPPAANANGGYMLMVNADYVASEIYRQNITNLCPNTYYEFSAWIKNICPTCGMDSIAAQFTGTATAPAAGYPGVYPNLSFALNDVDYYNSGEIDTVGWLNKGFVFKTGPSQTTATFSIRNNSQGGGGNDWVMDDITVATCLPSMSYSPSLVPTICEGNALTINDTIRSYFNNYTHYKWQRSTDGGAIYSDITAPLSVTLGPPVAGLYQYITSYTVPPTNTNVADSGDLYRVIVSTTSSNLGNIDCQVTDGISIISLDVIDCTPILDVDLLSFNGKLIDSKGILSWSTSQETSPVTFIIESSIDGRTFIKAGELPGYNNGKTINHYSFSDPANIGDKIWYRIVMASTSGKKKHSATIQLKNDSPDFELSNIINPFSNTLAFNITSASNSIIAIELIDMSGKTVLANKQMIYSGTNSINLANIQTLSSGIYTLRITNKDRLITKRVMKKN